MRRPVLRRHAVDGSALGRGVRRCGDGLNGDVDEPEGFVGMSSVTSPTEVFRFDAATGEVRPSPSWSAATASFEPPG